MAGMLTALILLLAIILSSLIGGYCYMRNRSKHVAEAHVRVVSGYTAEGWHVQKYSRFPSADVLNTIPELEASVDTFMHSAKVHRLN